MARNSLERKTWRQYQQAPAVCEKGGINENQHGVNGGGEIMAKAWREKQ
jgi:hypothetical protein